MYILPNKFAYKKVNFISFTILVTLKGIISFYLFFLLYCFFPLSFEEALVSP